MSEPFTPPSSCPLADTCLDIHQKLSAQGAQVSALMDNLASLEETAQDKTEIRVIVADLRTALETGLLKVDAKLSELSAEVVRVGAMAKDAIAITTGVDGRNGLRGNVIELRGEVNVLTHDMTIIKEILENGRSMKRIVLGSLGGVLLFALAQLVTITWFLSADHSQQGNIREDLASFKTTFTAHVKEQTDEFKQIHQETMNIQLAIKGARPVTP